MVFVFSEDGTLDVLERKELAEQYEPLDVENHVFVFYDEDGTWLQPRFTRPNIRRLWGLVVSQGAFELTRSSSLDAIVDPFDVAVRGAVALEPNRYFTSLEEVSAHVLSVQRSNKRPTD